MRWMLIVTLMAVMPGAAAAAAHVGYGRDTQGGNGGEACVVSNRLDAGDGSLRACLELDRRREVTCTAELRTILIPRPIKIASDLTWDASRCPVIRNGNDAANVGTLIIGAGVHDIVIHDLRFSFNPDTPNRSGGKCARTATTAPADVLGCSPPLHINGGADYTKYPHDIVIDHSSFTGCANKCVIIWNGADRITISRTRFQSAYLGVSVGADVGVEPGDVESHVTFYRDYFDDVSGRLPHCTSFARCHIVNTVVSRWSTKQGASGVSCSGEAHCMIEENFFVQPTPTAPETNPAIFVGAKETESASLGLGFVTLRHYSVKIEDRIYRDTNLVTSELNFDESGYAPDYPLTVEKADIALFRSVHAGVP